MQTSNKVEIFSPSLKVLPGQAIQNTLNGYFESLNQEAFGTTASLFSPRGMLIPPFTKPIQGQTAIANYLKKEAIGITLVPQSWEEVSEQVDQSPSLEGQQLQNEPCQSIYRIKGKVKTNLFTVNVAWTFQLNSEFMIEIAEVKLLASMTELIAMQS